MEPSTAAINRPTWPASSIGTKVYAFLQRISASFRELIDRIKTCSRRIFTLSSHQPEQIHQTERLHQFEQLPQTEQIQRPWKPRTLTTEVAMPKMWKNAYKAILEHQSKEESAYVSISEGLPDLGSIEKSPLGPPLTFSWSAAEEQGLRDHMEDAHFYLDLGKGVLTGVFDGHGGGEVSEYASKYFQEHFANVLQAANGNVHQAFEHMMGAINKEVFEHHEWDHVGSTAVVCYVDRAKGIIYTATLGDSEANLYRKINGQTKSIPLSCVRDWSCKKDAQRAAIALDRPEIAQEWPQQGSHGKVRFPHPYYGVNVSRAFGDKHYAMSPEKPGVFFKPKIAVNKIQKGDLLVVACDGLIDFVPPAEIVKIIHEHGKNQGDDIARKLVDHALKVRESSDNVTVLVIKVS